MGPKSSDLGSMISSTQTEAMQYTLISVLEVAQFSRCGDGRFRLWKIGFLVQRLFSPINSIQ